MSGFYFSINHFLFTHRIESNTINESELSINGMKKMKKTHTLNCESWAKSTEEYRISSTTEMCIK